MKYIKTYEFFTIEPTDEYVEKVKKSNSISEQKKELVEKVINEMEPKCEDVSQDIEDIFQEWIDDGIEFDDITLSMPSEKHEGDTISIYYPLGWQGKKEYHAIFGDDETNKTIIRFLEKNKPYYEVSFSVDIFNKAKEIQQVRFGEIDYKSEDIQHLFEIVKDCAEDMFNRLNSMYNIKVVDSKCFLPYRDVNNMWVKCEPIPKEKTSKVVWLLEINK